MSRIPCRAMYAPPPHPRILRADFRWSLQAAEAKKDAGKEKAKGNVPENASLGDRMSGAADAVSGKVDEEKYKGSAEGGSGTFISS